MAQQQYPVVGALAEQNIKQLVSDSWIPLHQIHVNQKIRAGSRIVAQLPKYDDCGTNLPCLSNARPMVSELTRTLVCNNQLPIPLAAS